MQTNELNLFRNSHRVIGHRGSPLKAPENTLQSLQQLIDDGIGCVEFDVRLCKTDCVVFHDDELDRCTNGRGLVRELNYASLMKLDASCGFRAQFPSIKMSEQKIPLFKDYLELCRKENLQMIVECKADEGEETLLVKQVKKNLDLYWSDDLPAPIIVSFSRFCLKALKELYAENKMWLAANFDECPLDWKSWVKELDLTSIHLWDKTVEKKHIQELKEYGLGVMVFTVNDPIRAKTLFDWGVDAVFSDCPDALNSI